METLTSVLWPSALRMVLSINSPQSGDGNQRKRLGPILLQRSFDQLPPIWGWKQVLDVPCLAELHLHFRSTPPNLGMETLCCTEQYVIQHFRSTPPNLGMETQSYDLDQTIVALQQTDFRSTPPNLGMETMQSWRKAMPISTLKLSINSPQSGDGNSYLIHHCELTS